MQLQSVCPFLEAEQHIAFSPSSLF